MRSGTEANKTLPLNGLEPTEADFIYFAGLFDGEGSLDLSTGRIRTPRLKIAMTDGPTIDWLYETLGGGVCRENPSGAARLPAWKWYAVRQVDVRMILESAMPHLKLKRDRALAALEVLDHLKYATGPSYKDDVWLNTLHDLTEKCLARAWQQRPSDIVAAKAQDRLAQAE